MSGKKEELTKLQQWLIYKAFIEEIKKLDIRKKLPNIYSHIFNDYTIDEELYRIETEMKKIICKHENTTIEFARDSHYSYENIVCEDCGKQLYSQKI